MSLTIVSTFFPLPQDRGDPIRVLMMLRAILRARPYTLLVVRRPDTPDDLVAELRQQLPGAVVKDYLATPYRLNRLGPLGRYPESFASAVPPWVRTRYSAALHDDLKRMGGDGIAIGEAAAAYFPDTSLRWHWDKANVLAASTGDDLDEAAGPAQRVRARYLAEISTRFESRALARCATVSVTSDDEDARLRRHHGRVADFTLPSCVPMPSAHTPQPQAHRLVWLGSFSYRSNLLGLRRFLVEAWPRLRAGGFTLALVGSGLTQRIADSLTAYEGVEALGYVDDLRPVLATARAGVVPLWSGAGVKLKTLTLLAHSVPVFSTSIGAEGVPATAAVRVAETPAALADELLDASPGRLDRMAAEAAVLIRTKFSEERFAARLVARLAGCGYLDSTGVRRREGQ